MSYVPQLVGKTYHVRTFGCQMNLHDSERVAGLLDDCGCVQVSDVSEADVVVFMTCCVREAADTRLYGQVASMKNIPLRDGSPLDKRYIAVGGCIGQRDGDKLLAALPHLDVVFGTHNLGSLPGLLRRAIEQHGRAAEVIEGGAEFSSALPTVREHDWAAWLPITVGCNNFCSYCIIPYTRGPIRSAPVDVAVSQAQELARRGYREIVVTGIEIASWGADLPGKPAVTELIEAVCNAVPALRVRLGSLEPRIVTEDFCRRLSRLPNLCPQFHLSMQSGCDTVLQRMRRKYDTARYYESVCLLRTWFPGCAVTTDMIVAFPGETEDEFAQSLAFIRKCGFAEMHIFPYSRRPGTPADKMPGQHGNAVKEARSRAAIAVAEEMSRAYREALVGSVQSVLFEDMEDGLFTGHAPNYVKVYVPGEGLHNQVRRVRITGLYKDGLTGSLEP